MSAVLLSIQAVVLTCALVYTARNRALLTPLGMFLLFFTAAFHLRPARLFLTGSQHSTAFVTDADHAVLLSVGMNLLVLAAVLLGHALHSVGARPEEEGGRRFDWTRPGLRLLLLVGFVLGLTAYFYSVKAAGGARFVVANLYFRRTLFDGVHEIRLFAHLTYIAALVLMVTGLQNRRRAWTLAGWAGAAVSVVLLLTFGGRFNALMSVLAGLVATSYYVRLRFSRIALGMVVVGFCLVAAGDYRTSTAGTSRAGPAVYERLSLLPLKAVDAFLTYDGQVLLAETMEAGLLDRQYGETYAWPLLNVIPRRYFEDKPPATVGGLLKRTTRDQSGGYPVGFAGEAYLNFGFVGVGLLGLLLGAALRWLHVLAVRHRNDPFAMTAIAITVARNGSGLADSAIFSLLTDLALLSVLYVAYRLFFAVPADSQPGPVRIPRAADAASLHHAVP
jgi:hypothetical protein